VFYIHADHLNAPRIVVDQTGAKRWRWLAEPFGTTAPETNPDGLGAFTQNLRFPGQYADAELGLWYNFFRSYDPGRGGYTQSDPIGLLGGSPSTYIYVDGDPLNYIDPTGLWGSHVHESLIREVFRGLPEASILLIISGSEEVDAAQNQIPGVGNDYEHAMRSPSQTIEDARSRMCDFIRRNMSTYNALKNSAIDRNRISAYRDLGRAMHPVMDSTSPMHRGFQIWRPVDDGIKHGNANGSLEGLGSLTPALRAETTGLMRTLMGNPNSCPCGSY